VPTVVPHVPILRDAVCSFNRILRCTVRDRTTRQVLNRPLHSFVIPLEPKRWWLQLPGRLLQPHLWEDEQYGAHTPTRGLLTGLGIPVAVGCPAPQPLPQALPTPPPFTHACPPTTPHRTGGGGCAECPARLLRAALFWRLNLLPTGLSPVYHSCALAGNWASHAYDVHSPAF